MAWARRGKNAFYYHSRRCGNRVRHDYQGGGARGRMAESIVLEARAKRAAAVAAVRQYWIRFEVGNGLIKELDATCRRLAEASLLAAGFWRSTSYRWRRRRSMNVKQPKISTSELQPPDLDALIKRARQGDDVACSELGAELDANFEHWKKSLDLAARSEQAMIDRIADRNTQLKEDLTRTLKTLKAELAVPSPTLREQQLVGWVVQSWLLCCEAEKIYTESADYDLTFPVQALNYMNSANHRLLSAIKELVTVRQLLSPAPRPLGAQRPAPGPRGAADPAGHLARLAEQSVPMSPRDLEPISKIARPGDDIACSERRAELDANSELRKSRLDLAAWSEQAWIALIAGQNTQLRKALTQEVRTLKDDLNGHSPTLLERLLVDRVAMSLLQCFYAEVSYPEWESCSPRHSKHALMRMDFAHRWHLSAIKGLVTVRQLLSPAPRPVGAQRPSPGPRRAADLAGPLARLAEQSVPMPPRDLDPILKTAGPGDDIACCEPGAELDANSAHRKSRPDLAAQNEQAWINRIADGNAGIKEALIQKVSVIKADLAGPRASLLERLLVDRVGISRIQRLYADAIYAGTVDFSPKQAAHARRCMDSAHRREISANKELATVRKMLYPAPRSVKPQHSTPESQ